MTAPETLPEPGPARDRLVAEVVGWEVREPVRGRGGRAFDPTYGYRYPSAENADTLAALEAWRVAEPGRHYAIYSPVDLVSDVRVSLSYPGGSHVERAPTLPSAATAALLATRGVG